MLLWMIFTGLSVFAAVLLWRYGLIRLMVSSDRTYISSIITVLYILTSGHCFWRMRAIAREGEVARRCRAILSAPLGAAALDRDAQALPAGLVTDHIRNLVTKAETQRAGRIDQTLLLRALADRLRGSNGFGSFVSDTLMKLGLLGTIIGFIIMLAPIAGARCGRQGRDAIVDGADERRHGGRHVHDIGGPGRLDPDPDPVLHARRRDPAGVFRCRDADGDARHPGPGARP